jgi:tetratricopeptide (TPR) repeat protein
MRRTRRHGIVFWLTGVIILAGLVFTTWRSQEYRHRPYLYESLYLPSGKFLEELSLGYKQVVADFVWCSAIQYYGEYRKGNHSLAYFEGLIDIVTKLDPHFIFAYIFGAWVVSEDMGDFARGADILRRGMSNNPTSWQLPFEIGFLNFTNRVDYDLAGRYLDLASRMPNAPERAKRFAAFVYAKGGEKDSSIRLWEAYKEYTDNPYLKEMAQRYIDKLKRGESIPGAVSQ